MRTGTTLSDSILAHRFSKAALHINWGIFADECFDQNFSCIHYNVSIKMVINRNPKKFLNTACIAWILMNSLSVWKYANRRLAPFADIFALWQMNFSANSGNSCHSLRARTCCVHCQWHAASACAQYPSMHASMRTIPDKDMNKSSKWVSVHLMMCGSAGPACLIMQSFHCRFNWRVCSDAVFGLFGCFSWRSLLPRCRTSWGGGWWSGLWRPPPSSSWPSAQITCPPDGGCLRSRHWCSGWDLEGRDGGKRSQNQTGTKKRKKWKANYLFFSFFFYKCRCAQRYWGQKTQCKANSWVNKVWRTAGSRGAHSRLCLQLLTFTRLFVLSRHVSRSPGVIHAVNLEGNWIFKRTTGRLRNLTVAISQPRDWEVTLCCVKVNVHYF